MRWDDAHRIAMIEAAHAHADLSYEFREPVDVFDAVTKEGLVLGFERFPKLSGVYVAEAGGAGIAVNANHGLARQRYSAAHELGHHRFGHGTTIDLDAGEPLSGWDGGSVKDEHERVAEAFAAWFLMPRKLVRSTLESMGLQAPGTPADTYQLSLRLGASYQATCRHLVNLRMVSPFASREWLKVTPRTLKAGYGVSDGFDMHYDVWMLGPGDREQRYLSRPGDRILLNLPEVPSSGYTWDIRLPTDATNLVRQDLIVAGPRDAVGQPCVRRVEISVVLSLQASAELESAAGDRLPATLTATKARTWQEGSAVDKFTIHLDIRPAQRGINPSSLQYAA